jgi:hypothetical protein
LPDGVVPVRLGVEKEDQRAIWIRHHPAQPRAERRASRDRDRTGDMCDGMFGGRAQIDQQRAAFDA